jgi:hypothetical protein
MSIKITTKRKYRLQAAPGNDTMSLQDSILLGYNLGRPVLVTPGGFSSFA